MKTKTKTKIKTNSKATEKEIVGLDLGDRKHEVCVLARRGGEVWKGKVDNTREAMGALSREHRGALVVMEVGMNSPWVSRYFQGLGHRVVVANARKVRAIYQNERKSDPPPPRLRRRSRKDAEMLARLARGDEGLLHPV
jgi:transposase